MHATALQDTEWYYAKIQAWVVEFYDAADRHREGLSDAHTRPVSWIDLRRARGVSVSPIDFTRAHNPDEVNLNVHIDMRSSELTFSVRSEQEANSWLTALDQLIFDHLRQQGDLFRHVGSGDAHKMGLLRAIWTRCVHRASIDLLPDPEDVSQVYSAYDHDRDNSIHLDEIADILEDLTRIRKQALHEHLGRQEKWLSVQGISAAPSEQQRLLERQLMHIYDESSAVGIRPEAFERRMMLLHQALEPSRDGHVSRAEFCNKAAPVILSPQELQLEARFYNLGLTDSPATSGA